MKKKITLALVFLTPLVALLACILLFPSMRLAASIGTGIGLQKIQADINDLHELGKTDKLSAEKLGMLRELYQILATGAWASFVLPASSQLMFHYLDGSGLPLAIDSVVFAKSDRVIQKKRSLITHLCNGHDTTTSKVFDMGGQSPADSAFALYFGTLHAQKKGEFVYYQAKMPWKWPTYANIKSRYGSYDAEIFPIPNILSLAGKFLKTNIGSPLYLPNALGGELERYGLAKSFNVSSTWAEPLNCKKNRN